MQKNRELIKFQEFEEKHFKRTQKNLKKKQFYFLLFYRKAIYRIERRKRDQSFCFKSKT